MILGLSEEELFAKGHRACAGCGASLALRHMLKAAGKNTIVCQATGCMEVVSSPYPQTSWKVPWIHVAFETAAAVASGVETALKAQGKKVNVLALGGDGGTYDIGFQALSGAAERGHNFCYVCYNNEAYMNTGIQRSGATAKYAATTTSPAGKKVHGKKEFNKDLPMIMAAHKAYVATANIAYIQDFVKKVQKGLAFEGPAYVEVFAPCTPGWKIATDATIDVCKAAYNSGITPLYEVEDGRIKFSMKPEKRIPVEEYLKYQGRFKHMNAEEIQDIQNHVNENFERLVKLQDSGLKLF